MDIETKLLDSIRVLPPECLAEHGNEKEFSHRFKQAQLAAILIHTTSSPLQKAREDLLQPVVSPPELHRERFRHPRTDRVHRRLR